MTADSTTDPATGSPPRRRRGHAFVVVLVVVIAGVGAAHLLLRSSPDPHEANAVRTAKNVLSGFTPPDGATPVSATPKLDGLLTGRGPGQQVVRTKRWHLTGDAMTIARQIAAHPPDGYRRQSDTPMKTGSGIIYVWFRADGQPSTALRDQGIRERSLNLSVANADDHTVELLAEASVNWARSRGSRTMIPAGISHVTVTNVPDGSTPPNSSSAKPRTVERDEDIDEITTLLNSLDPGPESTYISDCAGDPETDFGTFHLSFATQEDDHAASAVVDTVGCRWVHIRINGRSVGTFWGTAELSAALHRIHVGPS